MSSQIELVPTDPNSSPGISIARSRTRCCPTCTMATSGPRCPPKKLATSSIGFCVAETPMRSGASDLPPGDFQVLLHIIAQPFERGNVDHRGRRRKRPIDSLTDQLVDTDQKCGQGLARTCRG